MLELGRVNRLPLVTDPSGQPCVDAGELGLLSIKPEEMERVKPDSDSVDAFLYRDNDAGVVATLKRPKAQVGECANLRVTSITPVGIFMDWGLDKELFVPYNQQQQPMQVDHSYVVHLYLDNEERVVASAKLDRFLDKTEHDYRDGQQVNILVAGRTELGYKAIVENQHWGILYYDQVFQRVRAGEQLKAKIAKVRSDGKLDLSMGAGGKKQSDELGERILAKLRQEDGYLAISDKSSPQVISAVFGVSKGAYKKAIGALYKQGLITISKTGLVLNDED
ncbi:CvfB family protein [Aliagarivorans marinus]|uniref:CvfB family protein n=1 Tax=Aliagarivorans marinus TaxID=561965 RepID=UPI0004275785|nr:S1-like domain-containing RNA-binding protein [Aliagarivorans marinus]